MTKSMSLEEEEGNRGEWVSRRRGRRVDQKEHETKHSLESHPGGDSEDSPRTGSRSVSSEELVGEPAALKKERER